ncbi:Origin recognition complex subunit 3-like [Mycena kentingensis (nom. inval.)]|nr:Origin recognition complex subunit 3-like [Mycena kentingensis (nom. inval.)]
MDSTTTIYIQHQPEHGPDAAKDDAPDTPLLILDAYNTAWTRCFQRIKSIIADIYQPVASEIVDTLETIDFSLLQGLPSPELPVITISDLSGGSVFLDILTTRVDSRDFLVTHLYPTEASSIATALKNIINGFVEGSGDLPKRKAGALAAFDLSLLQAWFEDAGQGHRLVVFLHDFEQFDQHVMQDVFYAFHRRLPRLPLAFVLLLSTPLAPSYLQTMLPRSILSYLRPQHFSVPGGKPVLDSVLFGTFFDPTFDLTPIPGPALLDLVEEYYQTHHTSVDTLLNLLQVAYFEHFRADQCSVLMHETPPFVGAGGLRFAQALLERINLGKTPKKQKDDWRRLSSSTSALVHYIDSIRATFIQHAKRTKLGFALLRIVVDCVVQNGRRVKLVEKWRGAARICRAADSGEGVNGLATALRELDHSQLQDLAKRLHDYFEFAPLEFRQAQVALRSKILSLRSAPERSEEHIADALEAIIGDLLKPFRDATPIWDLWYTGGETFSFDLINPAFRSSVVAGLAFPHAFTSWPPLATDPASDEDDIQTLPDTSILFRGYLKAGKMINVYDWFDSFRVVLEAQRDAQNLRDNPVKRSGKRQGCGSTKTKGVR